MLNERANRTGTNARSRRAFTMVEMLIIVAIVILLLSILLVALNAASRAGQTTSTSARMQAISRALVQFRKDVGYLPPVLNEARGLNLTPDLDPAFGGTYAGAIQGYNSVTSLAEYLVGYGGRLQDGYGVDVGGSNTDAERPPHGIRHPNNDGVWNATLKGGGGTLVERKPDTKGDVFGPYLELDDPDLLASTDGTTDANDNLNVYFPGEVGYDENDPKVIVDFWGRPIHYHRKPYPLGGLRTGFMAVDRNGDGLVDPVPTLGDVYVLRPFEVNPGEDVTGRPDGVGDTLTTTALNTAEFALFSPGPDRVFNFRVRYDDPDLGMTTSFANRDNIVELGQ